MEWYLAVLKKYAVFEGRARRKEYWMFALFNMIFVSIIVFIQMLSIASESTFLLFLSMALGIYWLVIFIPAMAVSVRRLHDIGKSGWFMFVGLIPLVGPIWVLVLMCMDSQPGTNQYGPNPKQDGYEPATANSLNSPNLTESGQMSLPAAGAGTSNADFKFCPQCGSKNKISSTFCNQCGYKIPVLQSSIESPDAPPFNAVPPIELEIAASSEPMNETPESIPEPTVNAPEAKLKFCPQCGTGIKATNAFCNQCGYKMPVPQVPAQVVEPESKDIPQEMEVEQSPESALAPESPSTDIDDATQLLQPPIVPVLRILGNAPAEPVAIDTPEFVIGRNADATDYIVENNINIGRTHAKIVNQEGVYYLVDLESKNGTFINDVQISNGVPTAIQFGDVIKLANQEFVFEKE